MQKVSIWLLAGWLIWFNCAGCTQLPLVMTPTPDDQIERETPTRAAGPTLVVVPEATSQIQQEDSVSKEVPGPNPQVQVAVKDLATRLAVPLEQIELVDVEPVVWPDGSLGCPQPGMVYPQVQVDGLRIRLRAGGQVYVYHSGGTRQPFLCEDPAAGGSTTPVPSRQD